MKKKIVLVKGCTCTTCIVSHPDPMGIFTYNYFLIRTRIVQSNGSNGPLGGGPGSGKVVKMINFKNRYMYSSSMYRTCIHTTAVATGKIMIRTSLPSGTLQSYLPSIFFFFEKKKVTTATVVAYY